MAEGLRITRSVVIPERELTFRFSRSSGPGGQNANRRKTRVELCFDVYRSTALGPRQRARVLERLGSRLDGRGVLRVVASEARTQARNRELAAERLRRILAGALAPGPAPRRPTRPPAAARERRLRAKRRRGQRKRERREIPED